MPAESESDPYVRIVRRITRTILLISPVAAVIGALLQGWKFGLGLLLGAGLSYVSFWRWQRVVESLGGAVKGRSWGTLVIRFVVLVAIAYAMIKYLEVSPVAVSLGLLVSAAAVVVSIILELIYAGT